VERICCRLYRSKIVQSSTYLVGNSLRVHEIQGELQSPYLRFCRRLEIEISISRIALEVPTQSSFLEDVHVVRTLSTLMFLLALWHSFLFGSTTSGLPQVGIYFSVHLQHCHSAHLACSALSNFCFGSSVFSWLTFVYQCDVVCCPPTFFTLPSTASEGRMPRSQEERVVDS
jgi:hypothetical protein